MKSQRKYISISAVRVITLVFLVIFSLVSSKPSFGDLAAQPKAYPDWAVVGSGSAPLLSESTGDSETIYQAVFQPRVGMQWKGDLLKYEFDPESGSFDIDPVYSAGQKLQDRTTARVIYTPALQGSALTDEGGNLASFKVWGDDDKNTVLADMMGIPAEDRTTGNHKNFIYWLRGETGVGAIGDYYYRLFDIYHSGLAKVGPPSAGIIRRGNHEDDYTTDFQIPNSSRETVIYAQSNAGLLHCFSDSSGVEKWAFLPPNVRDAIRLRGLKWTVDKQGNTEYLPSVEDQSEAGKSVQLLLADGPVVAEDVFLSDGDYHTVLMGLLGFGGRGMYALDVTDPGNPKFMWALENPSDSAGDDVTVWKGKNPKVLRSAMSTADKTKYDYELLSFTGSTPFVGFYYSDDAKTQRKWIFAVANGQKEDAIKTSAIYIGDIETGEIIQQLQTKSNVPIVTPVAVTMEKRNSDDKDPEARLIKFFYVGDDNGYLYRVDISNPYPAQWPVKNGIPSFFDMETQAGMSYSLDVAKLLNEDGKYEDWVFCGTGDLERYQIPVSNQSNFFAGINSTQIIADNANAKLNLLTEIGLPRPDPYYGWKIDLSKDYFSNQKLYQVFSSPPVVVGGRVYFSTIDPSGTSRIYALDARTGDGLWKPAASSKPRFVELPDTIVSGISLAGNRLAVSVTYENPENPVIPYGFQLFGTNLLYDNLENSVSGITDPTENYDNMTPLYWKTR